MSRFHRPRVWLCHLILAIVGTLVWAGHARAVSATDFSYALTTQDDPVVPGQAMTFLVTVANQTNAPQSTTLTYLVPANTRFLLGNGFSDGPGTTRTVSFSNVPAGDSKATLIRLYVLNGSDTTPVDGTTITLTLNDNARALMFTRSVVVQSAPAADLKLSTNQASVARGGQFSYALAYHNASAADLANATLSLPLPAGVSLVSADHGGTLVNGAVQWTLPTVARRSAGQVQATFTAPVSGNAPLVLDATFADANTNVLAEASDTQSIFDTPDFIYTVTTQVDPVAPGKPLVLLLTATNQTIAPQPLTLTYVVPNYTQFVEGNGSADGPGSTLTIAFGTLAAGATDSRLLKLYVLNGSDTTPANGTLINFVAHDGSRAITFSRTAVVQSAPAADIELSAGQQSVAPGGQFTYELDCRAIGATPLSGATLSLRVPEGAAFVSADGNGALVGATVQWALGAIDPAAPAKLHATFTAPPAGDTVPTLLLEATLTDVGGNILATASDDRSIDALPDFTYVLTTTTDPVAPATDLLLNVTVTNLTNAPQSVTFYYVVPDYTQFVEGNGSADGPGSTLSFPLNQVAGGTSSSTQIKLGVLNGSTTTPPDGTLINVILYDTARNATISRLVTVHSIPKVTSVATATGTVGTSFSYQITATNGPTSFSASGLPDGLTIDPATGLISGVPTTAGTYKVMLGASSVGGTGTQLLTLTVNPAPTPSPTPTPVPTPTATPTPTPPLPTPPVIVAPPTVTATSGEVFFYQIVASNGATSYEAVGLPAGLTLDPVTGIISGTPTVFGTFIVSLTATNAGGSGTFALTLDIAAPAVPTVTAITAGDGKAVESGENGKVAIRRTGDTSLPLTVRYKVVGNVKAGTDYKPTSGTAVIPAGAAQVKIKIKPINDKKHEGMRVAKLKLKPALDGSYSIGGPAAAKVVLIDND